MVFRALPIKTEYWRPGADYETIITDAIRGRVRDGDFLVVSEKAISTARGNMVDESQARPGFLANFLAKFWTRFAWGCVLSRICHLKEENVRRLRNYPLSEGVRHKQVALDHVGFTSALRHGSEGGIDGSNLPYSYVSLPLDSPQGIADEIRSRVSQELGKKIAVVIVDSDKTYSTGGIHMAPRSSSVGGLSCLGFFAYLIGRSLRLKRRATPTAVSGCHPKLEELLDIARAADRARGHGAGPTVWDMAEMFGTPLSGVSWEMLEGIEHHPVVLVRKARRKIRGRSESKRV